jgi:hypothetical protein
MQGVFAELDKNMLVAKLRKARERIRKTGIKCDGRKRFGEKDGEQPILDRMKALRANGVHLNTIASILNGEGVPCRMAHKGKVWKASTIQTILTRKAEKREP